MTTRGRSAESAHARLDGHERECAVRYQGIQDTLHELKGDVRLIIKGITGCLIAILGWLAVQVYNGIKSPAVAAPLPQEVTSLGGHP